MKANRYELQTMAAEISQAQFPWVEAPQRIYQIQEMHYWMLANDQSTLTPETRQWMRERLYEGYTEPARYDNVHPDFAELFPNVHIDHTQFVPEFLTSTEMEVPEFGGTIQIQPFLIRTLQETSVYQPRRLTTAIAGRFQRQVDVDPFFNRFRPNMGEDRPWNWATMIAMQNFVGAFHQTSEAGKAWLTKAETAPYVYQLDAYSDLINSVQAGGEALVTMLGHMLNFMTIEEVHEYLDPRMQTLRTELNFPLVVKALESYMEAWKILGERSGLGEDYRDPRALLSVQRALGQ